MICASGDNGRPAVRLLRISIPRAAVQTISGSSSATLERRLDPGPIYSAPFVLGTPCTRGSRAQASLSARATALNWASTIWWALRP